MRPGSSIAVMAGRKQSGVNLSGTTGSPNTASDIQLSPTPTATAGWDFNADGSIDKTDVFGKNEFNPTPDEWYDPNGSPPTRYIRATVYSGSNPTSGPALSTIHALTTGREWLWTQTGTGSISGILKIEIFSDSGGTNLLATGYYAGTAAIDV